MEHLLARFPQLELQLAGDALKGLLCPHRAPGFNYYGY